MSEKITFQDWLNDQFIQWMIKDRRARSQNDFARYLKVSAASLSQWMAGTREPVGENVHRIADKLGPEAYEVLGLPPMMPRDNGLKLIASLWYKLNEDQKKIILDTTKELIDQTQ